MHYFFIIIIVTILVSALYFSKSLDEKDSSRAKKEKRKKKIEDEIFQSLKDEIKDASTTEAKEKIERAVRDQGYLEEDWQIDSAVKRIKEENIEDEIFQSLKDEIKDSSTAEAKEKIERAVRDQGYLEEDWQIDSAVKRIKKKKDESHLGAEKNEKSKDKDSYKAIDIALYLWRIYTIITILAAMKVIVPVMPSILIWMVLGGVICFLLARKTRDNQSWALLYGAVCGIPAIIYYVVRLVRQNR